MTTWNDGTPKIDYHRIATLLSETASGQDAAIELANEFQLTDPDFNRSMFLLQAGVSTTMYR
jgi:hypothetical protein